MGDGRRRPFLRVAHLYWRLSRGLTLGVRGIVLDEAGRVCLVRHTYVAGWQFPGGGVEPGETALAALARELREEAGIRLDPAQAPRLHGVFQNRFVTERDHVLAYVVRAFTRGGTPVPNREIADAGFFPLAALPTGTVGAVHRRLHELAHGTAPDTEW
jgi:8-oxo-dGTP pyrophosphatase MutT (NUDIX family)